MIQPGLAWELARKDLKLFFADRRGAVLCFAVPVLLASAFGAIFHRPAGADGARLPLLLVVEDDSPLTRRVTAALLHSEMLEATQTDRATALRRLEQRGAGVVLALPAGFGRAAAWPRPQGRPAPTVQVLHHPGSALESRWAEGVLTEVVLREAARELLAPLQQTGEPLRVERPFAVERAAVSAAGSLADNAYSHSFCGMTLQYLLFWGMDSGLALLRERRQGIWRRLRAAPVTRTTLLAGRALATALVALAQIAVTFAVGRLAFGVTLTGSGAGFCALALSAALLSAATGLLVAALGGSEGRARSLSVLAILTLSLLGGLWLPSFLLPGWVQRAALALPTTWAARGLEGVTWQGMGSGPALRCAAAVLGFSVLFLLVALWGIARSDNRIVAGGETA
ncbi:MAG TPA: ABC transporter permease [Gemmataceae bacterium]|jgi:ABC-2 type transport system permease protein|nr:ABC transporter permease [Gemmataceae bacterium]